MRSLLALACLFFLASAQQFSADIKVYDDPLITGVMIGKLNYDFPGAKLRVDWTLPSQTVREFIDYGAKLRFLFCATCNTETWTNQMPLYGTTGATATAATEVVNGVTCTQYNVPNNVVTSVWMNGATICKAQFGTGAKVIFSNVGALNAGLLSNAGWNCPAQTCNKMIDFALVFDESGSIAPADFSRLKSFGANFALSYTFGPQNTGMCLIMFDTDARVAIRMSFVQASFVNGVNAVGQRGRNTCIGCGVQAGQAELANSGRRVTQVLILLTDGLNNVNTGAYPGIVANAKGAGIIIFSIGVGGQTDRNFLIALSSTIAGVTTSYPDVPSFSALAGVLNQLVQATCINIPGNPCGAGCKGFCACGTCVCPSACDDRLKCKTGTCTQGANGNGCAYANVVCNDGNFCTDDFCDNVLGCQTTPTVCTAPDICKIPSCNPAVGCQYATKSCEDFNQCTDDTCVPTAVAQGGCPHPAIPCDRCFNVTCAPIKCQLNKCNNNDGKCYATPVVCDDGNACTVDSCDLATGNCTAVRKVCDDGNKCTKDMCDTKTGCYFVPFNATDCDDGSACTIDSCVPATGCVYQNITCFDNKTCTQDTCDSILGCQYPPMDCLTIPRIKRLLGTCYQALCAEERHGCYLDPLPGAVIDQCGVCNGNNKCAVVQLPSTVPYVVAGGLLAVVIIGAIIVGVALISFAGKKGYDIWLAHKGSLSGGSNNPLYNDNGLTGVNPTYTA